MAMVVVSGARYTGPSLPFFFLVSCSTSLFSTLFLLFFSLILLYFLFSLSGLLSFSIFGRGWGKIGLFKDGASTVRVWIWGFLVLLWIFRARLQWVQ